MAGSSIHPFKFFSILAALGLMMIDFGWLGLLLHVLSVVFCLSFVFSSRTQVR